MTVVNKCWTTLRRVSNGCRLPTASLLWVFHFINWLNLQQTFVALWVYRSVARHTVIKPFQCWWGWGWFRVWDYPMRVVIFFSALAQTYPLVSRLHQNRHWAFCTCRCTDTCCYSSFCFTALGLQCFYRQGLLCGVGLRSFCPSTRRQPWAQGTRLGTVSRNQASSWVSSARQSVTPRDQIGHRHVWST